MTRLVTFPDGFTSSSAPSIAGGSQENYIILNNQTGTALTGFNLDPLLYKSAFATLEIERNGAVSFRQIIQLQFVFDGADWLLTTGNSSGDDLLNSSITNPEMISLSIDSAGDITYSSGNLSGHTSSKLKFSIVRISV